MKSKTITKPVTLAAVLPVIDDVEQVNEEAIAELTDNTDGGEDNE